MTWAAEALGADASEVCLEPVGASGRVVRAFARGRSIHVKRLESRKKLEQARAALSGWGPRLGRVPELRLARWTASGGLLFVSTVPGEPMASTPFALDGEGAAPWSMRAAGRFLKDLHGLAVDDVDPVPLSEALPARARAWGEQAGGHVERRVIRRVLELVEFAARRNLRRVPCHRDFGPHNWLVHGDTLHVIDWEHARCDTPHADLERAMESMDAPGRRAFLGGYGADESLLTTPHYRAQVALSALARIAWAAPRGDRAFEESGRRRLEEALADGGATA